MSPIKQGIGTAYNHISTQSFVALAKIRFGEQLTLLAAESVSAVCQKQPFWMILSQQLGIVDRGPEIRWVALVSGLAVRD